MSKPKIDVNPVANQYTGRDERIVEFSSDAGGGLISLRVQDESLRVEVYRTDDSVRVITPGPGDGDWREPASVPHGRVSVSFDPGDPVSIIRALRDVVGADTLRVVAHAELTR